MSPLGLPPTGEFGSFTWHKNKINELEDRKAIVDYAKELGVTVVQARSLEDTKTRAISGIGKKITETG